MKKPSRHSLLNSAVTAGAVLALPVTAPAYPFSALTLPGPGNPADASIYAGDVNGDSLTDVAIHDSDSTLTWFMNTGGGNFIGSHVLSVTNFNVDRAAVADLDADGDADAVLVLDNPNANYNNSELAVFINNGSGFTKTQQFAIPGYLSYRGVPLVAADVDNDGDIDVATSLSAYASPNDPPGSVIICLNNGSGTLAAPVKIDNDTPEYPDGMTAGDFNNDGKTDLCVGHSQTSTTGTINAGIYLYSGLGQGNFGAPLELVALDHSAGFLEAADLNRDGRMDLISQNDSYPAGIRWRSNTGGSFSSHTNLYRQDGAGHAVGRAAPADLDEDGDPDIVWGRYSQATGYDVLWSRNTGAGQFEPPAVLLSGLTDMVRSIRPMDADLDGDMDLVMVTRAGLAVSLNKAIHRKVEPVFPTVNASAVLTGEPRLASADFDRDGDEDLLVLSPGDGTVRWLPANGGAFGAAITISTAAAGATAMATGDVTGDGLTDVVIGMPALGQLHVLRNVGNGATWQTQLMPHLADVRALHVADVDMDGACDVVASSMSTYRTVLFRNVNRNATSWTQEQVSTTINAVDQIQTVQFKRPGRPEILLTSYDPEVGMCQVRQLSWVNNAWSAVLLAQGNGGSSVTTAADLNGDLTNDFVRSLGWGAGWQPNYNNGTFNPAQTIAGLPEGLRCGRLADLNGDGKADLVAAGSGIVVCAMNTGGGSFAAPVTVHTAPGAVFRDVVVFDFERDGDLDLAVANAASDQVRVLVNRAGQFDTVSSRQNNGQNFMAGEEKTMIHTTFEHLGTTGDDALTLRNFRIQLHATSILAGGGFSLGAPLTAVEAAGLFEKITIYRDLGTAGTYDAGVDPVVATVNNFAAISGGYLTLPVTGPAAQFTCSQGQTMSFLLRPKMRSPYNTTLNAFNLTVVIESGGTAVVQNGISPDWHLRDRGTTGTYSSTGVVFKPSPLQQWRFNYWNTYDNTGLAANTADPDGDGLTNLVEYALNSPPTVRQDSAAVEVIPFGNAGYVRVNLARYLDPKVKVTVETSTNLATWTTLATRTGDNAWSGVQPVLNEWGTTTEAIFLAGNHKRLMAKLKVEQLP